MSNNDYNLNNQMREIVKAESLPLLNGSQCYISEQNL